MAADTLTISRLRIDCQATGGDAARRGASRLTGIARDTLGPILAEFLASGLPSTWHGSDTILHIPKLEISLDVDVDLSPTVIARAWAGVLAISMLKRCSLNDTISFTDPTARLTAFIADHLHGRAWDIWYWRDFEGLKPLDLSAALRTALLRAPDIGTGVLTRLRPSDLTRLLDALTAVDARQIVTTILHMTTAVSSATAPEALASLACRHAQQATTTALASPSHFAVSLFATTPEALASAASLGVSDTLDLCALILPESPALHRIGSPQSAPSHEPPGAPVARRTGATPVDTPLAAAVAVARYQLIDAESAQQTAAGPCRTPFGGAFLLWPHIAALPLDNLLKDHASQAALRTLQQAILACALDAPDVARIAHDPALAPLFSDTAADTPPVRPDATSFAAAFDPWFADERVTAANWRDLSTAPTPCQALKGNAQGYWLRLADTPEPHPAITDELLPSDPATDKADADALLRHGDDLLTAQLAQIVCKRMAYWLSGFANSSVTYLRCNLLGMPADVTTDDTTVSVTLDPAPLGIMLNLTGMSRMRYPLSDGRHVQLAQGDG